ncbi:MAG: Elongation factor 1-alpha [Methanosaeta sp. PtaB.Bin039]|nr:MAG: Elongation factor 1-alpha [Methanosaeta sp. PtaB.Bin039]OPY47495.1 MAG: Elongation factor 1-alpha [Methanosaeta sp. PtaU1.Bin028]HOT06981.1 EF-Tu/IF-2/RF-3 family GTPase [Methanotrichaceae archaeon]HQF17132.1 EF-Tu/IF-2/RF-3 family GTPase [Methanotrichaceae archaeon]HQI91532.1 EF-Tu/IF-2/RF-3 family GTPase [Methanotrichaceae archaeon]
MPNLNVVVLGPAGYSKELGKTGTTSDMTFYNLKRGEDTVTFIEPTRYPERLAPLFYAATLARMAVLVVEKIDPAFGECVLMLDCLGISSGYLILRNFIQKEQVLPLIKGTVAEGYELLADDPIVLRERLLEEATKENPALDAPVGSMPVDHFFSVRGVGTVVLGAVTRGSLKKHDSLRILPGEKTAQIRSIQKHDQDFDAAGQGERTGLALKGIEVDDLDRGVVLTTDPSIKVSSSVQAKARLVKYWPSPLKEGMVLHLGHWMQFVPARVESASGDDWHRPLLQLSLDKPLVHPPGASGVLTYPEGGKLRVVGTVELP